MSGVTQPVGAMPAQTASEDAIREWLDVLANGECSQSLFLQTMQDRFGSEPDGNWEVLSQLDQYYRRGKIKTEMFHAIKTALAGHALGAGDDPAHHAAAGGNRTEPGDVGKPPVTAGQDLRLGDVLRGRYRIESILGQGGMGTVFEAVDACRLEVPPSGQRLAIKVLHSAVVLRAELLTELRREFQHLQLLSHPNIVRVYEFERDGPLAFFTMELLSGALLSRVLQARKRVPLQRAQALAVIRDVGAAIAHAHSRGVVHGDINPQNIFITTYGELRVLDFGASHRLIAGPAMPENGAAAAFATPGYASCQVLEGQRPDARDDIFALACMAFLLFCGRHPFPQNTAVEARAAGVTARRPPNLTRQQWRALREGLAWEREKRPHDVQDWLDRLDLRGAAKSLPPLSELLDPPAPKQRKSSLAAVLLLVLALALGAAYWIFSQREELPRVGSVTREDANPTQALAPAPASNPAPNPASTSMPAHAPAPAQTLAPAHSPAPPSVRQVPAPRVDSPPPAATRLAPPALAATGNTIWPAKIEMAADVVDVPYPADYAQVVVRRKDNLRSGIGFTWWTESGTAKPGTDFRAVVPRVEFFQDGKSSVTLNIPLIDAKRAQPRNFYVVIDQPEGAAKLGSRLLTMVTLPPTTSQ
jgi:eukaryotic-like serine/threonine-protein kinase